MVQRTAVLACLLITLFGCLGGLVAALVLPAHYQAEADVVVYEMPRGFTDLLTPDEATNITSIYQAGLFQPQVVELIQAQFPQMTLAQLKRSVTIQLVAYTPLTRVIATASSPQDAVDLANVAATSWTKVSEQTLNDAYDQVNNALVVHEGQLLQQLDSIQRKLANPRVSSAEAATLQAQAAAVANESRRTDAALVSLNMVRFNVVGNAYVSVPATLSTTVMTPDPLKTAGIGTATGFALGFVLALWLTRRNIRAGGLADSLSSQLEPREVTYAE